MANSHDSTEPVAWAMPKGDGTFIDVITPAEHAREEGSYTVPLFAHPAAQQPQKLEDVEQYRMQMAGICTAAMGYWKEGDSIHPDYDTPALRDVAKLYAKYDALYKAQQPQAEAVPNTLQKAEARLLNLIGEYWALAYAEGEEGRNHDTEDGAAQRTHAAIAKAVNDLIAAASSAPQQAEAVPPGFKLLKDTAHDERSWPEDYSHENGCYSNTCIHCLRQFTGYKRRAVCKVCDAAIAQQKGANHG